MDLQTRRARLVLAVGTAVVAATSTVVALLTGAAAAEPGRCVQHANVREHPTATSRIVARCAAGTRVALGEERAGWVRLDELDGWAATDQVTTSDPPGGGPVGVASPAG